MPDVLLFGATGYTGRLTARALARREVSFVVAGRNRAKLERLAEETGAAGVSVAAVGEVDELATALDDVRVIVTCVGPFLQLGDTAVEAALRTRTHYIDSTGEGDFVARLIRRSAEAEAAGVAVAPAMGFDEVPADVGVRLATRALAPAEVVLTYAVPSHGSAGTVRSALGILGSRSPWIEDGRTVPVGAAERHRWAPMPPPLGPRSSVSFPLAEVHLAPLHTEMRSLQSYVTVSRVSNAALKAAVPALRALRAAPGVADLIGRAAALTGDGPDERSRRRGRWTILVEARSDGDWRNVTLTGRDVYGLTGELLGGAAMTMASPGYDRVGMLSPTMAIDVDDLREQLLGLEVDIDVYGPVEEGG